MKIANIGREILRIFLTTWGISMKFSGKMCLVIIFKVTEKQGFTFSLEDTFLEKPQWGSNWHPPPPPSPSPILGLSSKYSQKLLDHTKKSARDALKVASKRAIQKTAEATGDLIGNEIVDKIKKASKTSPKSNSETNEEEILKERYISPELR